MPTPIDLDALERDLLAALEAGAGKVRAELWQSLIRIASDEDAGIERLRAAASEWRAARGMPDEDWIVGSAH
jgi:hypothetical protein